MCFYISKQRGDVVKLRLLAESILKQLLVVTLLMIWLFLSSVFAVPLNLPESSTAPSNEMVKAKEQSQDTEDVLNNIQRFMDSKNNDQLSESPFAADNIDSNGIKSIVEPRDSSDDKSPTTSPTIPIKDGNSSPIANNSDDVEQSKITKIPELPLDKKVMPIGNDFLSNETIQPLLVTPIVDTPPFFQQQNADIPQLNEAGSPSPALPGATTSSEQTTANKNITPNITTNSPEEPTMTNPISSDIQPAQTPIPILVKDNEQLSESVKDDEMQDRNIPQKMDNITKEKLFDKSTLPQKNQSNVIINTKNISPEIEKFTQDEIQMLFLPNDDIVLGKLTNKAKLEQMDMYSFVLIFQQIFDTESREKQRRIVNNFIDYYDHADE